MAKVKIEAWLDAGNDHLYRYKLNSQPEQIKGWVFHDKKGIWKITVAENNPALKGVKVEYLPNDDNDNKVYGYELEFEDVDGEIYNPQKDKERRFWSEHNIKVIRKNKQYQGKGKPKPEAKHSQDTTPTDTHYRYCFNCSEWKKKNEINETDAGEQPGGGSGKSWNCNKCRKDLGETCLIFRCKDHESEIMKVWGTLDGVNKEKVFYSQCPQQGQEQDPNKPSKGLSGGAIAIIAIVALVLIGGGAWYLWKQKKEKDEEEDEL